MIRMTPDAGEPSVAFAIDRSRSYLEGIVLDLDPESVFWDLHLEFDGIVPTEEEPDERVFDDAGYLELSGLAASVPSWRELAGQSIDLSFESDEVHPILPDNPGNVYFDSRHRVPNANRVAFDARAGATFAVSWRCVAHAYPDDPGMPIEVTTRIALRRFQVYFDDPTSVDLARALELVRRFADADDLGKPTRRTDRWVVIPLRADAR